MAAQWHCDVVIVDRRTFRVVAAVELDDASHLKKSRCRRDILLDEVMRQAGMPLLRSRDARELQRMIRDFLTVLEAESGCQMPSLNKKRVKLFSAMRY
jgi:carbamoylphosphate synthase small subunit